MSSDKIGKLCKRASRSRSRSLERTLPICHRGPQYPPGCTVLECRFEADRPIARIVQVPADTAATARNSCLRVKRSSDSFSRMKPRRKDVKQRGSADVCSQKSDKFILLPASCTLKSHDRIDDSITLTETRDPLSQITRKNGLVDPSEIPCSTKKLSGKYKRQICPVSCCQPVQPAIKDVCSEFPRAKSLALDAKSSSTEMSSEKILRAEVTRIKSAKWDRKSTCQKPAVPFRRACSPEKISEDITRLREPSSRELFTRYKGYIPIYQLERYEACRSKRNGLQDECIPPLLRSILQKEKQQRTGKCFKRNVDQLDLRGMSESVNRNQPQILLYVE
ncbi:PREDICTED: uncharacterized protein LOC105455757 isoform X2 [Wasmannia auropunctata]|uniref:uncharacterized protein LOC105455757 isoform X2 n=1 Tax=Wasmannia auropunctata TaxID=64793 RepID=UPI0005EE32E8|nr:PREDICTED: uncharacterized protein LOC105455757 isoform X2 [Wasmannia auropunctata]